MEFEKLREIIAGELKLDVSEISLESTLMDDLGADSLDLFEIVMAIEEEFDIEFDNSIIMQLDSIALGDIVNAVKVACDNQ